MHGISLGTTRKDFNFAFASLASKIERTERKTIPDLSSVEEIWTGFVHDRVAAFEIDYIRETEWKNVREFAAHLERKLKLPIDAWVFVGETEAVMECRGFKASISSVRNTFAITDTIAKAAAQKELRAQAELEKKRVY